MTHRAATCDVCKHFCRHCERDLRRQEHGRHCPTRGAVGVDPDQPHRFQPLDVVRADDDNQARRRRRMGEWTRINPSVLPRDCPCIVAGCGASQGAPVHFDARRSR